MMAGPAAAQLGRRPPTAGAGPGWGLGIHGSHLHASRTMPGLSSPLCGCADCTPCLGRCCASARLLPDPTAGHEYAHHTVQQRAAKERRVGFGGERVWPWGS